MQRDNPCQSKNATRILPNTLSGLRKQIGLHNEGILEVPLCIGFTKTVSKEEFDALMQFLTTSNLKYTVYLFPNPDSPQTVEAFYEEIKDHLQNNPSIVKVDEWKKNNPKYARAVELYDKYKNDPLHKNKVNDLITKDAKTFNARKLKHQGESEQLQVNLENDIKTVEHEVAITLSMFEGIQGNQKKVLFYPGKLLSSIANVKDNPNIFGYSPKSLIHYSYKFEQYDPALEEQKNKEVVLKSSTGLAMRRLTPPSQSPTQSSSHSPSLSPRRNPFIVVDGEQVISSSSDSLNNSFSDEMTDEEFFTIKEVVKSLHRDLCGKVSPTLFGKIVSAAALGVHESTQERTAYVSLQGQQRLSS